jgi:hypothetical protein
MEIVTAEQLMTTILKPVDSLSECEVPPKKTGISRLLRDAPVPSTDIIAGCMQRS